MKRIRIMGLCLVAVFVAGALAAGSASAYWGFDPEYKHCVTAGKFNGHYTGRYTDKYCTSYTATHEGAYELTPWREGETSKFKIKSGKSILYSYTLRYPYPENIEAPESLGVVWKVECASGTGVGEITSVRGGWMQVTYKGCTGKQEPGGSVVKCKSAAGKGKIKTGRLATGIKLGLRAETSGYRLGIGGLYPEGVADFECGSTVVEWKGGLGLPEITAPPINACSTTVTLPFWVGTGPVEPGNYNEGVPWPWTESFAETEQTNGYTDINGTILGAGLQSTETLKSKQPICMFTEWPKE